jgi:hypothetical protein
VDSLAALEEMSERISSLANAARSGRERKIPVAIAQPIARSIARTYFEFVRPPLDAAKKRDTLVEEIDTVIQALLQGAGAPSEKQTFIAQISEITPYLLEATIDLMKARGAARLILSVTERRILETLTCMLPGCGESYEQALRDLSYSVRVSWRGTATELREVLREVIDHLAPDSKVTSADGFQLESGQVGPTQRQKVRFILRARRSRSAATAAAEATLSTVEESVAILARSTYTRGAVATHTSATDSEIRNLKRYVDALLAELLEIG